MQDVPGWEAGILKDPPMRAGGERLIRVPNALGFGARSRRKRSTPSATSLLARGRLHHSHWCHSHAAPPVARTARQLSTAVPPISTDHQGGASASVG